MYVTAYDIAQRFVGMKEVPGSASNPQIMAMLNLDQDWPEDDEVPWCAAFLNYVAWLLRLTRSKSLRARSWLQVGEPVPIKDARVGFDVVILSRGKGDQPGPEVINAPGHVGFFSGIEWLTEKESAEHLAENFLMLGGNQSNTVSVATYPLSRILGVRRLLED